MSLPGRLCHCLGDHANDMIGWLSVGGWRQDIDAKGKDAHCLVNRDPLFVVPYNRKSNGKDLGISGGNAW